MLLVFVALVVLGAPIVLALGAAGVAAVIYGDVPITLVLTRMFSGVDSFPLLAIPFFVLAGELMNSGGITRRLLEFSRVIVGHLTGGLAQVNVVTSMLFAGISGSSAADVSSIGSMLIPAMKREGYSAPFSVAITATSACLGNIIPPSLFIILAGAITGISIGGMFLGGIVPGLLIGGGLTLVAFLHARRAGIARHPFAGFAAIVRAFREAFLALLTPAIILGGIVFGIVTPTEAGVLAVVYSLFLGLVVFREYRPVDLLRIVLTAARTTAIAVVVLMGASVFSWVLARARLPTMLTEFIGGFTDDRLVAHLLIILILLLLGTVMEATSALIIFVPFLYPVALNFGIDPVHFGVTAAIALVIGLVTPPIGMILFLASTIGQTNVRAVIPVMLPQLLVMVIVLFAAVLFPPIVTAMVRLL